MAFNISSIQDSLNKFIVAPAAVFGLAGFVFDVEAESTTRLSADITDHYTEDNSVINDHMAIRPLKITVKNYVGELVYLEESKIETFAQDAIQKLTILSANLPALSRGAQQIKNAYAGAGKFSLGDITSSTLNQFRDIYALTKNLNPANGKQNQAYLYFKSLMESRTIMSFQSPFEFLTDMLVEEVVAVENADSKFISDFTITLKKIRFASTSSAPFKPETFQGRAAPSKAPEFNLGKMTAPVITPRNKNSLLMESLKGMGLEPVDAGDLGL